ncbi:hypothetical protein H4S02_009487 [Coemansia sp. RSA 2611]|nr:hypothetical protein IWW54_001203 [Coemansia sp. RSA 2705]KAJ2326207.1 hypothetical protein IWW51_002398 [Coemansia sp. RSA 2702]KAJ2363901.1 hypothetical protein H4S01_004057 [Coemansia sp. RSA 2610]KAJ2371626.1 hypothetical protein H4S02_009487 [Coemansia sp. RSA 2611]
MVKHLVYFALALLAATGLLPVNATTSSQRVDANWRQEELDIVNQLRRDAGLLPLKIDDRLNQVAQEHSEYMAKIHELTHEDPAGPIGQRVTDKDVRWTAVGENVASGPLEVDFVVSLWSGSAGHNANMLGNYNYVGFGLASDGHTPFWTQVFAYEV